MVHTDGPEEGETRSEGVDVDTGVDTCAEVLHTVREGVSHLDVGRSARLLHVIAGDGDGVELGHVLRGVLEDVGNDAHRKFGRIDVGVTHHELLEDVVLDRSLHLLELSPLLQTGVDVEREDGQHGAVHGHGYGHFAQGNTVEKHFHILQRADRYTGFTNVAHHAGVISVVAAVRRQVEGYGETFLTRSEVTAIEGVRLLGRGESGVLTDGPRAHGVHAAVRATQVGRQTGGVMQVLHAVEVFFRVYGFHLNVFRRFPIGGDAVGLGPLRGIRRSEAGCLDIDISKVRSHK